jgi:CO/xanthine dehydrogenase FAD-binding subunit
MVKEIGISRKGSLESLLALGDVTVKPWRQKRIESGYEKDLLEAHTARSSRKKEMKEEERKCNSNANKRKNEQTKS